MTAIWPAGPPKLSAAILAHVRTASANETGESTADYIDGVLGRITLPGGLFLAGIAILPILVSNWFNIPNTGFGGTSVLIVVGVLLYFNMTVGDLVAAYLADRDGRREEADEVGR